jgi:hypothetical protein
MHFVGLVSESKLKMSASTFGVRRHLVLSICRHYYLLTPWSRVLLESQPVCSQLVKKSPALYGTQRFITPFKSARHLSLSEPDRSSARPHIPLPEDPSTPGSFKWSLFLRFLPPTTCMHLSFPHTCYIPRSSYTSHLQGHNPNVLGRHYVRNN